jgi:site-specific DNA-methyltransferase (adenine-specific)|tara:strand:- start:59 stop:1009 length:951 start_codon:yes stop_codon:yes gene_type:complete
MIINGDCIEEMQKLIDQGVQVDAVVTDPPYHLQSIVDRFGKTSLSDNTKTSERARARGDGYARMSAGGFMGQEWDGGDIAFRAETWRLAWELLKPGSHLLAFSASRNYHRMAVAIEDAGFEIRDQMMWLYGSGFPKSHNIGKNVDKTLGNVGKNEWEGWGTALKPAHEPIAVGRKPISESTVAKNVLKHRTGAINIDASRIESVEGVEGRFPANIMHDGLQQDWARFFYCPKVSKKERGENNKHPTVKPQELMKYLVRLVTPKGGTVLDPFMGSGSTGMAAKDLGFDFIGIEKSEDYFKICQERIEQINPLGEFLD